MLRDGAGLLVASVLLLGGCAFLTGSRDPAATQGAALARRALTSMGGRSAWRGVRFIEFTVRLIRGTDELERRTWYWDRQTGRVRMETTEGGRPFTVVMNLRTGQGLAARGNDPLPPEALPDALAAAGVQFEADAPRLHPAVFLDAPRGSVFAEGETELDGRRCIRLRVEEPRPDGVRSRLLFVEAETGRPVAWAATVADAGAPVMYREWTTVRGVAFPTRQEQPRAGVRIVLVSVAVYDSISDRVFMTLSGTTGPARAR